MQDVNHHPVNQTKLDAKSRPDKTWRHWRVALAWLAACVVLPLGLAACGGSDSAPPITSVSAVIDAAGGTLTGPDGVQVIIPAGALNQATTIGIARSSAGAPGALDAYPVSGFVYEITPHDLSFNVPVTVRAPVGTTPDTQVFMASPGQPWINTTATVTNGIAEWQRSSFSWMYLGACFVPTSMSGDPYWCSHGLSSARISATPASAMTQTEFPRDPANGAFGTYRVDQNADLQLSQFVRVPGNCSNVTVRFLRRQWADPLSWWHPDVLAQTQALPTQSPVMTAGPTYLTGTATMTVPFSYADGGHNQFVMAASYDCPSIIRSPNGSGGFDYRWDYGNPRRINLWGDGIMVEGKVPTPTVFYTVGGTVSGLTGTGLVLQNSGGDNLAIAANATSFTFNAPAGAGAPFAVTVLTQPTGQTCTVSNGSGTASANVTNVAVSCAASSAPKAWQGAALIETNNAGGAESPEIAFDVNGNAFAVWFQWDGTRYDVWANRYTPAGGWQTPLLLESGSGHASAPAIAMDANGNAIAVWQQSDGPVDSDAPYSIWANRYSGGAWGTAQLIETDSGDASSPRVAFDATGNAFVVWSQIFGGVSRIRANRFMAGAWGSPSTIDGGVGNAYQPQVAVFPGGSAVAVWIQSVGGFDHIFSNTFNGTGWSTADVLDSNTNGGTAPPHLAADANGNAIAVWSQGDGVNFSAYTSRFSAGSWGLVELLETSIVSYATQPRISMNPSGDAMAVWLEDQSDSTNPWARRYTPGVGWGTPVQLDNGNLSDNPNVAIDPMGHAVAVWAFMGNLYAKRYTFGTGWAGTAELLENTSGSISYGIVAMDANGNAITVWSQHDGTRPNIWANVYK